MRFPINEPINVERFRLPDPQVLLQRRPMLCPSATTSPARFVLWLRSGDTGRAGRPRGARREAARVTEVVPTFKRVATRGSGRRRGRKVQGNTCATRDLVPALVPLNHESATRPVRSGRPHRWGGARVHSATSAGCGERPRVGVAGVAAAVASQIAEAKCLISRAGSPSMRRMSSRSRGRSASAKAIIPS
jgi:hypothetical protein